MPELAVGVLQGGEESPVKGNLDMGAVNGKLPVAHLDLGGKHHSREKPHFLFQKEMAPPRKKSVA